MADKNTPGRLRKAWRVSVKSYDHSEVVFAATAGKARVVVWHMIDDPHVRIIDITPRREPSRDVILPARDAIADTLSEDERHSLLHAFGADQGNPAKAGYRDYFYTNRDDPPLVGLTNKGLMTPMAGDKWGENMTYFVMTDAGKRVALSMVPEYAS